MNGTSPMQREHKSSRSAAVILLVIMFLSADLLVTEMAFDSKDLDDNKNSLSAIIRTSALDQTYISSLAPNSDFSSDENTLIGTNSSAEARGLISFQNTITAIQTVDSAILNIHCISVDNTPLTSIKSYAANIYRNWRSTDSTWLSSNFTTFWQASGGDGDNDRSNWELPGDNLQVVSTNVYNISLNVTKLVQETTSSYLPTFNFIISAVGGMLQCAESNNQTSSYAPSLSLSVLSTNPGNGGSVESNFVEDGMALMSDGFILQAETNPTLSYTNLNGVDVEFQLSLSSDFRDIADLDWHYSTFNNGFSSTSNSGNFTIPSADALPVGNVINYRIRSLDSTGVISNWDNGNFLLPDLQTVNNNDGTATLTLTSDIINLLSFKIVEDVEVKSNSQAFRYGTNDVAVVSANSNFETLLHTRLNLHEVGLHSNSTINSAELILTRSSFSTDSQMLSMHSFEENDWVENEANWIRSNNQKLWREGGLDHFGHSTITGLLGNQTSSEFRLSFEKLLQSEIDNNLDEPIELSIAARLGQEGFGTGSSFVEFHTSEAASISDRPKIEITYSWSQNTYVETPELTFPPEAHPVWNISGHNLSGNTTPMLSWNGTISSSYQSLFQLSKDEYFRDIILELDTRDQNLISQNTNSLNLTGSNTLELGTFYHWRMINYNTESRFGEWDTSSFLVSSLTSSWLGGNEYQMSLEFGTESNEEGRPLCRDSTLFNNQNSNNFGSNTIDILDTSFSQTTAVFQCDIRNYMLPSGFAVISSSIALNLESSLEETNVGVWEGNIHNWTDTGVNWFTYDGVNNWPVSGVQGSSRGQLLDTQVITSSAIQGDEFVWNITSATQYALRDSTPLDLIFDSIQSTSSIDNNAIFNSSFNSVDKPVLSFIYVPGSNQLPDYPTLDYPINGEWLYESDFNLSVITKPVLDWSHNSSTSPASGWVIQIDNSNTFGSPNSQMFTSWNDAGFDLSQTEYEFQSDLDIGQQWFWRVRALSSTYQLGDWSNTNHFYLPDLDITLIDQDHFSLELRHDEVLSQVSIPHFEDTYLDDRNGFVQIDHSSETEILVGSDNSGENSSGLIRMSLDPEIQPSNSRVISANINLYANPSLSTNNLPIAVRPVLKPWTSVANSTNYDTGNSSLWSELGGRGIGVDIGSILDIQQSNPGWMSWNVTHAVQQALSSGTNSLSLMLYNAIETDDQMVHFYSVDSSINRPYLELIWSNGSSIAAQDYPGNDYPLDNGIAWDVSNDLLEADFTPMFEWSLPSSSNFSPDSWRVFIDNNIADEMEGQIVFDSRDNPSYFDLTHLTFEPPNDLDFSNHIQWSVQGIENGMIGETSNKTAYWLPEDISGGDPTTSAYVDLSEGSIVEELNFPLITTDTYLDEGDPNNPQNGQGLYVGKSPTIPSSLSSSLISFDFSSLPMPSTYEILGATLELTEISNVSGLESFFCSEMLTDWDESSTWATPSASTNWIEPGAFHSLDSELPFIDSVYQVEGLNHCDITSILQKAIANGDESVSIIIQPEFDDNGAINGQYIFADSENPNIDFRPTLNLEYRTTAPWIPSAPVLSTPADGATLWNYSSPLPQNVDSIDHSFTQTNSNATDWTFCLSGDQRLYYCLEDLSNLEIDSEWLWHNASKTLSFNNSSEIDQFEDEWVYWKVLATQDHRIGEFSNVYKYRIPNDYGVDDGNGNYSYELTRALLFETTGILPEVLDASIDANNPTSNTGTSSRLNLGYDSSNGGDNDILLDFDLSQIPWPAATTPTSMILELTQSSTSQSTTPLTVSAYACSNFAESSVTYANAPSCGTTEITRTTILPSNSGVVEWDLTALAQSNFANGNLSFTIILDSVSSASGFEFYSSDSSILNVQPKLIFEYVDNIGGIIPPSQPVLSSPSDGSVLYDTTTEIISSVDTTTLSWSPSTGATSYIVSFADQTSIMTYDSRFDSEISGTTFTTSIPLEIGEVYTWWVQAINQTIPGPSSSRWSFATGDPIHFFVNDGTYAYEFQDGSEVEEFGHVEIRDAGITDALADSNFGTLDTMTLGTGCLSVAGSECYGIFSLDASQVPLDITQTVHSADLTFFVESWDLSGGAYEIEFSIHEFLYSNWDENSITWNTTGVNPGLIPGVDYNATPLDVQTYTSTDSELEFQIAIPGMLVDDERHWIIIANPISSGAVLDGLVNVYSSDAHNEQDKKPIIELHTTNVSALNITTSMSNFDADTPIVFEVMSFDRNGVINNPYLPVSAIIEWSSTTGSISQINTTRVSLTPSISGIQTIHACYGVICTSYDVDIAPGVPVQLIASLNYTNSVLSQTINADETVEIFAYVLDQFGNEVTSEVINYFSTNGSMGGASGTIFYPYSVGSHILTAQWIGTSSSLSVDMSVIVTPGSPTEVEIQGCQTILASGTSCPVYATVFDQFGNLVWFDDVGNYQFSINDGSFVKTSTNTPHSQPPAADILVGDYTGDKIGNWSITISTSGGLTDTIYVEVTFGAMASLELIASEQSITADEFLFINATRIDINGNRLPIIIPLENWTKVADGIMTPGIPNTWEPSFQGTKLLTATHESFTENVSVFVSRGVVANLEILIDDLTSTGLQFNLTADQSISSEVKAIDGKGNLWYPAVNWSISHSQWGNQSDLSNTVNSTSTRFSPVHNSIEPYIITASYYESGMIYQVDFSVKVSIGDLENFIISANDINGVTSQSVSDEFSITADQWIEFYSDLSDFDGNIYNSNILTWILVNKTSGEETDITTSLVQNAMRWEASTSGEWQIYSYAVNNRNQNLTYSFDINVEHGLAISIQILTSAVSQDAGDQISLAVNGFDSDGNVFPQLVDWKENGGLPHNINSTSNEAEYVFNGRISGNYTLLATYAASTDSVEITVVSLLDPKYIEVNSSKTTLEQLESLSISVVAYDEYWNLIDVPASSTIDATGRADVSYDGQGKWVIETLDEGKQIATISVGTISYDVNYTVEGNIAGFFAAGGSLYYVGAGLIILVGLAILALGFRFIRGDGDYYDDEDEEDFDYDLDSAISSSRGTQPETVAMPPATPPAKPPSKPEPIQPESNESEDDWMIDYRVEDDGTEWGQADDETWYYRESGQSDWIEWTD